MRKLIIGILGFIVVWQPHIGEAVECRMSRQAYPLLRHGGKVVLAAELKIGIYPSDTTSRRLLADWRVLPQEQLYKIPEYLIVRKFLLTREGNEAAIMADYHGSAAKSYAKQTQFRDMNKSRQVARELVADIRLVTKARFGPILRIRYKRLPRKKGRFIPSWASFLRMFDGRYYFIAMTDDVELFNKVAESFPYWEPIEKRRFTPTREYRKLVFVHPGGQGGEKKDYSASRIVIYYLPSRLPPGSFIMGGDQRSDKGIEAFLRRVIRAWRSGDREKILPLWHPAVRRIKRANMTHAPLDALKPEINYYRKHDDFRLDLLLEGDKEAYAFISPLTRGKRDGKLRLIRIVKRKDAFYLCTNHPTMPSFMASGLLGKKAVLDALDAVVRKAEKGGAKK